MRNPSHQNIFGSSSGDQYPLNGLRVHVCTNYVAVNGHKYEVEINTPVRKSMMHVMRKETIEKGMMKAMEKNINRKVALTRKDHGIPLGNGAGSGGFPSSVAAKNAINDAMGGGNNQMAPGVPNSNNMDQLFVNEKRLMENTVLMNYEAMRMDAFRRSEMFNEGFGEISLTGMGYGIGGMGRSYLFPHGDPHNLFTGGGDIAGMVDHTPPPSVLPPNSDMFVYPEATLNPMLLNLIKDKRDNIYRVFGVRPVDDIAGGGDSANVSLKSQFAMASSKNGDQAKFLNEQMRVVYAYMMADMYGEDLLQDALAALEYEYEKMEETEREKEKEQEERR